MGRCSAVTTFLKVGTFSRIRGAGSWELGVGIWLLLTISPGAGKLGALERGTVTSELVIDGMGRCSAVGFVAPQVSRYEQEGSTSADLELCTRVSLRGGCYDLGFQPPQSFLLDERNVLSSRRNMGRSLNFRDRCAHFRTTTHTT